MTRGPGFRVLWAFHPSCNHFFVNHNFWIKSGQDSKTTIFSCASSTLSQCSWWHSSLEFSMIFSSWSSKIAFQSKIAMKSIILSCCTTQSYKGTMHFTCSCIVAQHIPRSTMCFLVLVFTKPSIQVWKLGSSAILSRPCQAYHQASSWKKSYRSQQRIPGAIDLAPHHHFNRANYISSYSAGEQSRWCWMIHVGTQPP